MPPSSLSSPLPSPVPSEAGVANPCVNDFTIQIATVNGTGSFVMEAKRVGPDTLLGQIVRLVSEAQRSRAPIQRVADVVSAWFVPAVVILAIVTFLIWNLV